MCRQATLIVNKHTDWENQGLKNQTIVLQNPLNEVVCVPSFFWFYAVKTLMTVSGLKSTNDPSDEKVQQACNKIDFKCDAFPQCQYGMHMELKIFYQFS